jgi:NADPH-dependent 2,4-dienoyl-CoA reductase/sulfur reductase-like enzyme
VIIGGGAAGAIAAETLRQGSLASSYLLLSLSFFLLLFPLTYLFFLFFFLFLSSKDGFKGQLILVTKEKNLPYDRTSITKGFGTPVEKILLRNEDFYKTNSIQVHRGTSLILLLLFFSLLLFFFLFSSLLPSLLFSPFLPSPFLLVSLPSSLTLPLFSEREVTSVNTSEKVITFADGSTLGYDSVLFATGGVPRILPVPGAELENIIPVRTVEDGVQVAELSKIGKKVVVVGTSFIGMEAASALKLGNKGRTLPPLRSSFTIDTSSPFFLSPSFSFFFFLLAFIFRS